MSALSTSAAAVLTREEWIAQIPQDWALRPFPRETLINISTPHGLPYLRFEPSLERHRVASVILFDPYPMALSAVSSSGRGSSRASTGLVLRVPESQPRSSSGNEPSEASSGPKLGRPGENFDLGTRRFCPIHGVQSVLKAGATVTGSMDHPVVVPSWGSRPSLKQETRSKVTRSCQPAGGFRIFQSCTTY